MAEEKSNTGPTVGIRTTDAEPKAAAKKDEADKSKADENPGKVAPARAEKRAEREDGNKPAKKPQNVSGGELKYKKALDNREGDQEGVDTDEFVPQQVDGGETILPATVARDTHE